jgi:hypothetical protein
VRDFVARARASRLPAIDAGAAGFCSRSRRDGCNRQRKSFIAARRSEVQIMRGAAQRRLSTLHMKLPGHRRQ